MKPRSLVILAIVFVALLLAAKFAGQRPAREAPGGLKPGSRLFGIDDFNKVAHISISSATQNVVLTKSGANKWVVESLFNYPADFDRVADDILNKFDQLRVAEARKADAVSLKDYGLDPNATGADVATPVTVMLSDSAGKELGTLKIGKERNRPAPGGQGGFPDSQFVQLDKGPVVLIGENIGRPSTTAKDWISTKLLQVPAEQIERVTVDDKDGKTYELTRDDAGKYSAKGKAAGEEVKDDGARSIFGAIGFLSAAGVAGPADKTADNFAGSTNRIFSAVAKDGSTYRVEIGKTSGELRAARIAVGYVKPSAPPPPAATGTNAAEVVAKAAKEFEDKTAKDKAAAGALNSQLAPWTFLIEETTATTLSLSREQVIGIPPPPSTNGTPDSAGAAHPGGFSMPATSPAGFPNFAAPPGER